MLKNVLQQRYLANTWEEIVSRLSHSNLVRKCPNPKNVHLMLLNKTFIPAGNTLTYLAPGKPTLHPNCSVFDNCTSSQAISLWERGIGMGTTCHPNVDPVLILQNLQESWDSMKTTHRPVRGNMFTYPWNGKYIDNFINVKGTSISADKLRGFNISVRLDHQFEKKPNYRILYEIARASWSTGDPGIMFERRVNYNVPIYIPKQKIRTLVPCGEQGMYDGEYCTLGSINLNSESLKNFDGTLSESKLKQVVCDAVDFLDNAVDNTIEYSGYRRIGLGVLGWADYLESIGLSYDSDEAIQIANSLSRFIGGAARERSTQLSLTLGAFTKFHGSKSVINENFCKMDYERGFDVSLINKRKKHGMRNISVTCLPPTGGITLITENSGFSIEPFFHESLKICEYRQLEMLNAWQEGMCNSVSKTIQLPEDSSVEDVYNLYTTVLDVFKNVKCLSVYRNNSRKSQPIMI